MTPSRPTQYWAGRRTEAHQRFRAARDLLLRHRADHRAAYAEFRWPRSTTFNWALEWFDVIAEDNAASALELLANDGTARRVSFADLSAGSDSVANWLTGLGIRRGDRVLIVLGAQHELWECVLACLKIGAVVIPSYPSLTRTEAADRVRRGGVRHVVCRADLTALFDDIPVPGGRIAVPGSVPGWSDYSAAALDDRPFLPTGPTRSDELAFCYFTSGTTAAPKLVGHTHASYPVGHLSSLFWNGLTPGDRHLNVSAPGWAKHSWSSLFVPWSAEATILVPPDGPARPELLPRLLMDAAATTFCAPPSTWQAMRPHLRSARPPLREAMSAGEPLAGDLSAEIGRSWGVAVRDGYGQTETTGLIGTTPGLTPRAGWAGLPLPGYRIVLRDPATGRFGDTGEICVDLTDGPVGVLVGYLDDAEATGRALADGVYHTGDLGERDATGWIRVLGRRDDVFKSFDHRISPYELEAVLGRHPAVSEVAVVPRAHPIGGAVPHAVVVAGRGHAPGPALGEALLAHAALHLAPDLRPRSVEFADRLPRTTSGKIRRAELR
ncbi:AMP-binding protein [Solihabitans fulvus]|uniref:AMP-binding protein n=1 Tax=Solihabitans fulvus TaxID=1892852 RepID=UPI001661DC22|nr:AMP-binding protein [Solihabitans fulvus]